MIRSAASKVIWVGRARTLALCVLALLVVASFGALVGAKPAHAADFRINYSTEDVGDYAAGDGQCSTEAVPEGAGGFCTLRAAIQEANANDASDTITFSSSLPGTITLTLGKLAITDDITGPDLSIEGPEGSRLTVSGNNNSGVFKIDGADTTIDRITITGGSSGTDFSFGAGIYNHLGTLTLTNSTVSGNTTTDPLGGGGIYTGGGTLTLTNSTVSGNTNTGNGPGGGIANFGTTLTLTNSTVSGNTTRFSGGGIYNGGGTLTLTNSTVSGNTTEGFGGGIYNCGCTAKLANTIVARNTAGSGGPDVNGTFTSEGNNLIGNTTGSGSTNWSDSDLLNRDPLLGPLRNNGGPTKTHALLQGSPAIDRGTNAGCVITDQRGFLRQDGNADGTLTCDIGAFEAANTKPTVTNLKPAPASSTRDRTPLIAATVRDEQTNLAKTNIKLFLDEDRKGTFSYDRSTDRLSYTSGQLAVGRHTVKIVATEGVNSTTKRWSFEVVS